MTRDHAEEHVLEDVQRNIGDQHPVDLLRPDQLCRCERATIDQLHRRIQRHPDQRHRAGQPCRQQHTHGREVVATPVILQCPVLGQEPLHRPSQPQLHDGNGGGHGSDRLVYTVLTDTDGAQDIRADHHPIHGIDHDQNVRQDRAPFHFTSCHGSTTFLSEGAGRTPFPS